MPLTKEQVSLTAKICLLLPVLMLLFIALCTMNVSAATDENRPGKLSELTGPSQGFLDDWQDNVPYILIAGNSTSNYKVYGSAILDDGTIVYACCGYKFVAVTPQRTLIEGQWGERVIPKRVVSNNYTFEPVTRY